MQAPPSAPAPAQRRIPKGPVSAQAAGGQAPGPSMKNGGPKGLVSTPGRAAPPTIKQSNTMQNKNAGGTKMAQLTKFIDARIEKRLQMGAAKQK